MRQSKKQQAIQHPIHRILGSDAWESKALGSTAFHNEFAESWNGTNERVRRPERKEF